MCVRGIDSQLQKPYEMRGRRAERIGGTILDTQLQLRPQLLSPKDLGVEQVRISLQSLTTLGKHYWFAIVFYFLHPYAHCFLLFIPAHAFTMANKALRDESENLTSSVESDSHAPQLRGVLPSHS